MKVFAFVWLAALTGLATARAAAPEEVNADVPAEEEPLRPVHNVVTLQWGQGGVRDTYLTPLLYEGSAATLRYDRDRRLSTPLLSNLQTFRATFLTGSDGGDHGECWSGRLDYRYALHFGLLRRARYALLVGPYAGAELGFNYNLKLASSNNPATAQADVTYLGASVAVAVPYRLGRQTCYVHFGAQSPLLGTTLMTDYGASYYETFYLDDYAGDDPAVFTSLHNQQNIDLRLTTEVPFALVPCLGRYGSSLTLGVHYRRETMKVNHIVRRFSALEAVVGWSYQQVPYRRGQAADGRRTVLTSW
jgi:hypothetical protein